MKKRKEGNLCESDTREKRKGRKTKKKERDCDVLSLFCEGPTKSEKLKIFNN